MNRKEKEELKKEVNEGIKIVETKMQNQECDREYAMGYIDALKLTTGYIDSLPDVIDWEQRRYEIARDICAETTHAILMRGNDIGDRYHGMTVMQAVALYATDYADALIEQLKKMKNE